MRLCGMRPFAGTHVWEQVNSTWRSARALTSALEDTVEQFRCQDEHDTPWMVPALQPAYISLFSYDAVIGCSLT
jgi:hypothetical protein